jgi:hypothetical protein
MREEIRPCKPDNVFEMGEGTVRHRLIVEWHETVGIGYPKDEIATCQSSAKHFWLKLRPFKGRRVLLHLLGNNIVGVERDTPPGWTEFDAIGIDLGNGILALDVAPWDR